MFCRSVAFLFFILWCGSVLADPLYGRENLAAFYGALVNSRDDGKLINIHIVGDSKVSGVGVTEDYRIDRLLYDAAKGYPINVTFAGFGGQNSYIWAHEQSAAFIAQHLNASLLIIDFGTNESVITATGGSQSLEQTKANNLAAIEAIRSVYPPSDLSILIMGQPPANNWNPRYNQTTANMKAVNGVLKEVAEETNSAFFDPMELFQRAHSEAGWMEQLPTPFYGGGNVHPGNAMNLVMIGTLANDLFPIPYR